MHHLLQLQQQQQQQQQQQHHQTHLQSHDFVDYDGAWDPQGHSHCSVPSITGNFTGSMPDLSSEFDKYLIEPTEPLGPPSSSSSWSSPSPSSFSSPSPGLVQHYTNNNLQFDLQSSYALHLDGCTAIGTNKHLLNNNSNNNNNNNCLDTSNNSNIDGVSSSYQNLNLSTEMSSVIPSTDPYPGDYDFHVSVEEQTKRTKSPNYYYSVEMKRLYAKRAVPCPFLFRAVRTPPQGAVIRVTPVFHSEHQYDIVRRCPTHVVECKNEPRSKVEHMMISDHREARHVVDQDSRRFCLVIPYEEPQVGSVWSTCLIQFMCFNSCFKNSAKKPLHLIFTLEHNQQVIGRQVILARMCACPGRDFAQDVRNMNAPQSGRAKGKRKSPKSSLAQGGSNRDEPRPKAPSLDFLDDVDVDNDGSDVYELKVKGRMNFEILLKVRDCLHLASSLPTDILNKYVGNQMESVSLRNQSYF